MKKRTEYQNAKSLLKEIADVVKSENPKDKPMQRAVINDTCDSICKDLRLSDYYRGLLGNYACTLHPKD
jgi:hypothetical protein